MTDLKRWYPGGRSWESGPHQILYSSTPIEDLKDRMRAVLFEESDNILMEGMHQILMRKMSELRDHKLETGDLKQDGVTVSEEEWELWADPQNWGELPEYGMLFDQLFDAVLMNYLTSPQQFQEVFWN